MCILVYLSYHTTHTTPPERRVEKQCRRRYFMDCLAGAHRVKRARGVEGAPIPISIPISPSLSLYIYIYIYVYLIACLSGAQRGERARGVEGAPVVQG